MVAGSLRLKQVGRHLSSDEKARYWGGSGESSKDILGHRRGRQSILLQSFRRIRARQTSELLETFRIALAARDCGAVWPERIWGRKIHIGEARHGEERVLHSLGLGAIPEYGDRDFLSESGLNSSVPAFHQGLEVSVGRPDVAVRQTLEVIGLFFLRIW